MGQRNYKYPISPIKRPVDKMNSIVNVLLLLTFVASVLTFALPNLVEAKITFCANSTDIFQCFIKENDCKTFSANHPGTECIRSKS
jgi:hypothetical protein